MKIQLKRSNVLENSSAKVPTADQLDYGEIAVNYNAGDPVVFIKDSNNNVIRIAGADSAGSFSSDYDDLVNKPTIGNGDIVINAGNGLSAAGDNATANQEVATTRTLSVLAADSTISVTPTGIAVNNSAIAPNYSNIVDAPTSLPNAAALSATGYISGSDYDGSVARTWNVDGSETPTASYLAAWDSSLDLSARLFRSTFQDETSISGGLCFRTNNSDNNYIRTCTSQSAIRTWLDVATSTGGNASGTWSIDITGNAATANTSTSTIQIATSTWTAAPPVGGFKIAQVVGAAGTNKDVIQRDDVCVDNDGTITAPAFDATGTGSVIEVNGTEVIDSNRKGNFSTLNPGSYTTATRPTGTAGDVIYNSTKDILEVWDGTNWVYAGGSFDGLTSLP